MISHCKRLIPRWKSSEKGAAGVVAALSIFATVACAAFAIDLGFFYSARRTLQASSDAAAVAGAQYIYAGQAIAIATSYSSVAGGKNDTAPNFTTTMATGFPQLKCLTSIGLTCGGPSNANAIVVRQHADVPLFFARIFGIKTLPAEATSTAAASGGRTPPMDIMIIVDTTGSMNTSNPSCSVPGSTRIVCALKGVVALLSGFSPCAASSTGCGTAVNGNYPSPMHRVGLMIFPGTSSATQAALGYDCSSATKPAVVKYSATTVYKILPLTSDFKTSNAATALNTASNLVRAARAGAAGCTAGLPATGGVGTFYADVLSAAQAELVATGRPGVQRVIIILSDGDATASSTNMPPGRATNQCRQAITAAQTAKTAGSWVYSIAYGATVSAASSCPMDSPTISACETMRQLASDPSKFYSDQLGGINTCSSASNPSTDLVGIFKSIGGSLATARLVPNKTI
ncbi:MAG: TadG family pilus assembly protein [Hyphomicrobiales bacterium]